HIKFTFCSQGGSYHPRNKKHEDRQDFKITGCNSTSTGTLHYYIIIFAFTLSKYTLYDMLVGTPIPETDDRSSDKYPESRIILIHRVCFSPVKHMVGTISVSVCSYIHGATRMIHHFCPSCSNITVSQG